MIDENFAENIDTILQHITSLLSKQADQLLLEQLGIGYSQYRVMVLLTLNVPIKQIEIATRIDQTEASISRQIKLLEGKSLILKTLNPKNKRIRWIRLTPLGFRLITSAKSLIVNRNHELLQNLDKKSQKQIFSSLETINYLITKRS